MRANHLRFCLLPAGQSALRCGQHRKLTAGLARSAADFIEHGAQLVLPIGRVGQRRSHGAESGGMQSQEFVRQWAV